MRDLNLFADSTPFALSGKRMHIQRGLEESWGWVGNSTKNTAGIRRILDAFCLVCPLEVSED